MLSGNWAKGRVFSMARSSSAKPRRWPARLALVGAIIAFLVLDLLGGLTLAIHAAFPQTTGALAVAGAQGTITIARDHYGVPHIHATNAHDLFFAQGYVTAQDRLWQMEFNRRVAAGRLSEILGSATVKDDEFLRTVGLAKSAQADVDALTPDLHAELDAYTQGVNAFLQTHQNSLPLEFTLLGFKPEPWTDADSIAYGKVVALDLDNAWSIKLARFSVLAQAGAGAALQLFPDYPADNPTLTDATGAAQVKLGSEPSPLTSGSYPAGTPATYALLHALSPMQQAALAHPPTGLGDTLDWLHALLGGGVKGSNDWVIAGSHTTTGMPIVANDPHLGINYPAIWYEVGLDDGDMQEFGYSFPGVPGIIIGHNAHIAWGVTNGMVDDTDLYLEKLSADGTTYLYNGQQLPVTITHETIKVAGGADVHLTVRATNHGPIINSVIDSLHSVTTPIALEWTALQPQYTFAGFFELGAAQNWQQFLSALQDISISQNFVYADTSGNIGYHLSGWLPIRPAGNALLPVDGTTSANDWTGRVPFEKMPALFNPPSGIILTANNQLAAPGYPWYITDYYDVGYRAKRIEQLLTAKPVLSVADIERIQNDTVSVTAQELAPYYINAASGEATPSTGTRDALALLKNWDGDMTRQSAAAAFYEATSAHLVKDLAGHVLSASVYKTWTGSLDAATQFQFLRDTFVIPAPPLLNGPAARDAAIVRAENEAASDLAKFFGTSATSSWQWGAVHQANFDHPLASVSLLKPIFPNQSVARPGDSTTVNVGGAGNFANFDYAQDTVASMREIIPLGSMDSALFVTTTGESGLPWDPHNFDLLPLWNAGRYQTEPYTQSGVQSVAVETLTITP
jgi:penicillin G amidase